MAVTVTDNATSINTMDATTGVTSILGSGLAVDPDIKIQGTNACVQRVNSTGLNGMGLAASGSMVNRILMIWGFTMQAVNTLANGGWRLRVSTAAGATANYHEYDVAGSDTMVGQNSGFQCFAVNPSVTPSRTSGTAPNLSSLGGCALVANTITANGRESYFQDLAKHLTQTYIRGGTAGAKGTSAEIAAADKTAARGTFQYIGGAYFLLGEIQFGTTAAATNTYFADTGVDWLFQDMPVGSLHGLSFVGGTGTNEFTLGTKVGTGATAVGTNGGLIHRAKSTSPRWFLDALEADITVGLYGVQMSGAQKIRFEGGSNIEVLSCSFVDCDTISIRNGAILRGGSVIANSFATTAGALDLGSTNPPTDSVRDLQINNNAVGILLQGGSTGTFNFDLRNIKFNGNTVDVRVDFPAGATVNINNLEGSNCDQAKVTNVNGSTVNVNTSVTFQLDNVVPGSQIYVAATAGGTMTPGDTIIGPVVENTSTFSTSLNITGQPFRATVAHASSTPKYVPEQFSGTITAAGFTRRLSQQLDE